MRKSGLTGANQIVAICGRRCGTTGRGAAARALGPAQHSKHWRLTLSATLMAAQG